ncbi:hypothetical protein P9927_023020, partial [Serratia nevei]|nr:hypothetical protein [Serratia nevei]
MLDEYKKCIEACYLCATACDNCAASCLDEENLEMMRELDWPPESPDSW